MSELNECERSVGRKRKRGEKGEQIAMLFLMVYIGLQSQVFLSK